ncbi:MAG TPA: sigma-54 dependent transcriptional regulator [Gemmatimonadaceae bacterium]|nr:sigma-54 dependent transcriptional regulator [Gemmatimonadaceae bacterium]
MSATRPADTLVDSLVGDSPSMQRLRALVTAVAPSRIPVLIEGPTGSGKELVAALLHRASRRSGPLVAFNVCALSDSMFEDALFGHVKGAFTGALGDSLGFLREARGGTAFLDEISGLPLHSQAKLLRALETGVVRPVGSSRDEATDCRIVTATNEHLDDLVHAGRFRADLAHRLSGVVVAVPPLADRREDIPQLVHHFACVAAGDEPDRSVVVATRAIDLLQSHDWPGNVRQLRLAVEAARVIGGGVIDVDAVETLLATRSRAALPVSSPTYLEREQLVAALAAASGDTERAAEQLGVHRATIYRRMKRLGIPVPTSRVAPSVARAAAGATPAAESIRGFAVIRGRSRAEPANSANALQW